MLEFRCWHSQEVLIRQTYFLHNTKLDTLINETFLLQWLLMSSTQNYHLHTNCSIYLTFSFSHLLLLSIFTHFVLYYLLHGFDTANDISSLNKKWRKCKRHLPLLGLFLSVKALCTLLRNLPRAFLVLFSRDFHYTPTCGAKWEQTQPVFAKYIVVQIIKVTKTLRKRKGYLSLHNILR